MARNVGPRRSQERDAESLSDLQCVLPDGLAAPWLSVVRNDRRLLYAERVAHAEAADAEATRATQERWRTVRDRLARVGLIG